MSEYLKDMTFLAELDKVKLRTQYAKLVLLDYAEQPIKEIQGQLTAGSVSVNGSAAVRRTINLTMNANLENNDLENIDNEISINKKVKVFVGLRNPLKTYAKYGEIIWFPCGLFLVATANISKGTNSWSISITGKDKMARLDGTAGGVLPASVTLTEKEEAIRKRAENNYSLCASLIETLTETNPNQLELNDAKLEAKKMVEILAASDEFLMYHSLSQSEYLSQELVAQLELAKSYYNHTVIDAPTIYETIYYLVRTFGEEAPSNIIINDLPQEAKLLIKYRGDSPIYFKDDYSSFSYNQPEDIASIKVVYNQDVGYKPTPLTYPTNKDLIANAGETVVSVLDKLAKVLGNFEFFYDLDGRFVFQEKLNYLNTNGDLTDISSEDYFQTYSNTKYKYLVSDFESTTSISKSPKYDNIKNDYIIWGKRKSASGTELPICYHLAVDVKPPISLAGQYMWKNVNEYGDVSYDYGDSYPANISEENKIGGPCGEWREEIYRQALLAQSYGSTYSVYDAELLATDYTNPNLTQWRKIYDPIKWGEDGWNPDVKNDPGKIDYWLDFIDDNSEVSKFSVNMIGRRSKVISEDSITSIFNTQVPDVIFLTEEEVDNERYKYYDSIGQQWFQVNAAYEDLFVASSTQVSAFDRVRELLYQHLTYNTQITLQCFPKYYLEPNNIVRIEDLDTNTIGNYAITQFSLPLTYNGTMSITLTEVLNRI